MRRTQLFATTLRQAPADVEMASHQFLLRGAYVQPLAAGVYSLLPLGYRVAAKIETILREEMDGIGGQELTMPVVHPAELWQETGRWYDIGPEMVRFKDRGERDMVLAMTHEEVIADLLRRNVRSYRQLPVMLYQLQTKFRDEPRARGGLMRTREFIMKDGYSCHGSFEDLDRYYPEVYDAYLRIFRRCGIDAVPVQSDVGMMGGTEAHEFMFLADIGEDQLVLCDNCGYSANRQVAVFRKDVPEAEDALPLEEVATPETPTIAALAELLHIPESRTAKATFFKADDRLIFAVVRGDMEVNETKLTNAVGASELRPATAEELEGTGIVPGYASPIGVRRATIVVDDLVAQSPNLVAGANREGFHLRNTNFPRDYAADIVTDIAAAEPGAACIRCREPLRIVRGVEVGNIFKLGTKYTKALGATFLDEQGQEKPIVMASYGIGVGRLMASVAEGHRDDRGLIWPVTVAPYHVYLVGLDLDDEVVREAAGRLYNDLRSRAVEVLYDDRAERAGVKFNDADLLGMPVRLTVSRRMVERGGVELKRRAGGDAEVVPAHEILQGVEQVLGDLREKIVGGVRPKALVEPV